MESVTVGGPGLVAVGGEIDGEANVAVWTSIDGITWFRVPHDDTVFSVSPYVGANTYGQAMESVTASPYGLIAVGFDVSGGNRTLAAVWVGLPED